MRKYKGFISRVKEIINKSDVILEIVDARDVKGTRLRRIEDIIKRSRRKLIIVINKIDLYEPELNDVRGEDYVLISAKDRKGKKQLMEKLNKKAGKVKRGRIVVGVVGYPNVGKSSIINYLTGRRRVKIESTPGSTKGEQFIRLSNSILLIDTPGVYRTKESQVSLALKFAYPADRLRDPIALAIEIIKSYIKHHDYSFLSYYKIKPMVAESEKNPLDILEHIGRRKGFLIKGGVVNMPEVAKTIIRDYQKGILPPIRNENRAKKKRQTKRNS